MPFWASTVDSWCWCTPDGRPHCQNVGYEVDSIAGANLRLHFFITSSLPFIVFVVVRQHCISLVVGSILPSSLKRSFARYPLPIVLCCANRLVTVVDLAPSTPRSCEPIIDSPPPRSTPNVSRRLAAPFASFPLSQSLFQPCLPSLDRFGVYTTTTKKPGRGFRRPGVALRPPVLLLTPTKHTATVDLLTSQLSQELVTTIPLRPRTLLR